MLNEYQSLQKRPYFDSYSDSSHTLACEALIHIRQKDLHVLNNAREKSNFFGCKPVVRIQIPNDVTKCFASFKF